jgi:hypothetical protein
MHGSPCSGPADVVSRFYAGRHAMVSYAHPEQLPVIAEVCQSFALDNGAFSAWNNGEALDVAGYQEWVSEWCRHPGFDWCLIPDVIDGTEEDNDAMLEAWDSETESVPVWHLHESLDRLARLADHYRIVALGSSGQWATPGTDGWKARMAEAMRVVCDDGRPRCRLHGLRMLNPAIFTRYPFSSADSTNAPQNAGRPIAGLMSAWQRANVIADRIEAYNSAAAWQETEIQLELFA